MKFSLDDDTVLRLSGVASGAYALRVLVDPDGANKTFYNLADSSSEHRATARWFGHAQAGMALQTLSVGTAKNSKEAKKNLLKGNGLIWLAGAAMDIYNAQEGVQKKDTAYAAAGLAAALGGLCLWRGFAKDDKDEEK